MSNAPNPDAPAESTPSAKPLAKPRSKVERAIVWGLIGVLSLLMLTELWAHLGFQSAYNSLTDGLEADVEDHSDGILTEAGVNERLGGRVPQHSESLDYLVYLASRVDTYEWPSLLKTRTLHVYYGGGDNPDVVSVTVEKNRTRDSYYQNVVNENRAADEIE